MSVVQATHDFSVGDSVRGSTRRAGSAIGTLTLSTLPATITPQCRLGLSDGSASTDGFTLQSIQYGDEISVFSKDNEAETPLQRFEADFYIMTQLLSGLLKDLFRLFTRENEKVSAT